MPQLLVAPLATFIGTLGVGSVVATAVSHIAIGAGMSLLQTHMTKKAMARGTKSEGVKFSTQMGDTAPLSIVVGDYATSGKRKYIGSWGKSTRYITEVIEVSAMPQGLAKVWVNDELGTWHSNKRWAIPSSASPSSIKDQEEVDTLPAGALDLGRPLSNLRDDGNRIYVKFLDGNQTVADPFLVWAFGSDPDYPWTGNMVGKGKSYAIVTTRYDSDTLTSYPSFLWEPAPLPMYDPRKDSSTGGTGAHRWGNRSTYEPSRNPMVIAYNVARGIYYGTEHVFGGQNLAAWRLPRAAWVAAMNACDATVNTASGTEPAYRAGMEIELDGSVTAIEVLEELALSSNAKFSVSGGALKPVVGVPLAAALFFTDENILVDEGQSFQPFKAMGDSYNAISSTYPSRVEKWSNKETPEYIDTNALAVDGGRYRSVTIGFPAVPHPEQVQRLQMAQLKDYRRERHHSFSMPPRASTLEPAVDAISWTSVENGYIAKRFIIESSTKGMDLRTQVTMREVDPSDYDWNSVWENPFVETAPVATLLPVQIAPDFEVYGFIQKDADDKHRKPALLVTVAADEAAISGIQIQVRRDGETDWTHDATMSYVSPFRWIIPNLLPDTNYWARIKLHSRKTPRSTWSIEKPATTPNVLLTEEDIEQSVWDSMEEIATQAGIKTVDTLPPTGDRPNQLVLLVPPGKLYRWDADAGEWSEEVYGGIPDGAIDIAKFAQGLEPVTLVTGSVLPSTKSTTYVSMDNKLYKWNGSSYGPVVNATDLDGQLQAAQIAALEASKITGQLTDTQIAAVAAAKVTGTLTASQIANGAITIAKFATGLEPVGLSTAGSLPTVKTTSSLMWNNRLYYWNGSAYSLQVQAVDIAGQIAAAQIAALEASKITGQIAGTQISDNAISTPKLAANAVTAAKVAAAAIETAALAAGAVTAVKLAAGSVEADKIATNAITADKVAANAITTAKIAAGAITATEIAVGAITAGKMALVDQTNIIPNGWATDDPDGWEVNTGWSHNPVGTGFSFPVEAGQTGWGAVLKSKRFGVQAGDNLLVSYDTRASSGAASIRHWGRVHWFDSLGAALEPNYTTVGSTTSSGALTTHSTNITVPEGAFKAELHLYINRSESTPGVTAAVRNMTARLRGTAELIVDGAIVAAKLAADSVTANALAAGAVTAGSILAGAITTDKVAANAITTAKIATNAITANEILANAVTTAKIATGAVTANEIATNAITADKVAANAITTAKIAAGAVTAAEIAAGAVAVRHLLVSNFTNLFAGTGAKETSPLQPTGAANGGNGEWSSSTGIIATHKGQAPLYIRGTWPNGTAYTMPSIDVKAGEQYHISYLATRDGSWNGTTGNSKLRFGSVDTGAHILSLPYDAASVNHFESSAGPSYRSATLTIPDGTTKLNVTLVNDASAGIVHLSNFEMRLRNGGELIVDGAITATKIATDAVTANSIAAGAVVATAIATGAVTADKILANAVTAAKIATGAVTATKIDVTSLSAVSATIGTLRTATSGARLEIHTDRIMVYDAGNVLRVRIGNLG